MSTPEDNAETINRYLELASQGRADDVADLYASDGIVEDPVGGEVHIGREAIRGFSASQPLKDAEFEVFTLRALGSEVAFYWSLTITLGESRLRIEIISVMTFDDEGKIASMKAYWSPENVTQL
jgi:steroid Delta-isomerase